MIAPHTIAHVRKTQKEHNNMVETLPLGFVNTHAKFWRNSILVSIKWQHAYSTANMMQIDTWNHYLFAWFSPVMILKGKYVLAACVMSFLLPVHKPCLRSRLCNKIIGIPAFKCSSCIGKLGAMKELSISGVKGLHVVK